MKIATVSLNQEWEDKAANKKRCEKYIEKASLRKADIIIFPEMTLTGFSMNIEKTAERFKNSETVEWFRNEAKKHKINIVFGYTRKVKQKANNDCVVVNRKGNIEAVYTKIHPFSYAGEDKYFISGKEIVMFNINGTNIGLTICYDLRFPEIYQGLSKKSLVIINIANWPDKRKEHWETLLKARAIENQVFMIGVNRTGKDGKGNKYAKSTKVFGPNGKLIKPKQKDIKFDIYKLEIKNVINIRKELTIKEDRMTQLYKNIL